jgi:hypothetical protein
MTLCNTHRGAPPFRAIALYSGRVLGAVLLLAAGLTPVVGMTGCATDEVGHSKTTTKQTTNTPSERTTVTETHEKDTTLTPR